MARRRSFFIVTLGGAIGTAVRAAILAASPVSDHGFPLRLVGINTVGVLIASFVVHGPLRDDRFPRARLFALSGCLGGLTSYSSVVTAGSHIRSSNILSSCTELGVVALVSALSAAVLGRWIATRVGATS